MTQSKDIRYYGRDFKNLKQGLVDFAKVYYPDTYSDFNETSPGMMFIEMAAYVGDVLNYYIDSQLKESILLYATEQKNVLAMAAAMGYKPKLSIPSNTMIDVYQLIPSSGSAVNSEPDMRYALKVGAELAVRNTSGITFIVRDGFDFSQNTYNSPTETTVYQIDQVTGQPQYYLMKKTVEAISAQTATTTFAVGNATKFLKLLVENNGNQSLIGITSIVDADGNTWTEVPYLAQDSVFVKVDNTALNDPDSSVYSNETPYLLKLNRVPRRYITRVTPEGIEIQFGAGIFNQPDEELLPLQENLGLNLPTGIMNQDVSYDPTNPIFTQTYGIAPSNTSLTVTYLIGGGVQSNVPANTINEIVSSVLDTSNFPISNPVLTSQVRNSLAATNATPATGGRSGETVEEVRQNALATLRSQNRAVTREDYIIRALSMPSIYGSVAKIYVAPDEQANIETVTGNDTIANPLALNLYTLGYNSNKQLTTLNTAVKSNLSTYISQYKMLTDAINIKNGYYVNIGCNFSIIASPELNSSQVLLAAVQAVKNHFNIDRWQINQPIYLLEIYGAIRAIEGVQTVTDVVVYNLNDSTLGYSSNSYDLNAATKNGIIYPSLDPCIFEVRFPDADIRGSITTY